jgi:hypothetical protein
MEEEKIPRKRDFLFRVGIRMDQTSFITAHLKGIMCYRLFPIDHQKPTMAHQFFILDHM